MEIIIIIGVAVLCFIVSKMLDRKQKNMENEIREAIAEQNGTPNPDTPARMSRTLIHLGCQPQLNDDNTLVVQYQGETFHVEFFGLCARIWDPYWAGTKTDDPDFPKLREAVNNVNFKTGPTIVYTAPDKDGIIGLHSRMDVLLHPACPDNEPYVKAALDSFFLAKEELRKTIHQIDVQQKTGLKTRRPVGFDTAQGQETEDPAGAG